MCGNYSRAETIWGNTVYIIFMQQGTNYKILTSGAVWSADFWSYGFICNWIICKSSSFFPRLGRRWWRSAFIEMFIDFCIQIIPFRTIGLGFLNKFSHLFLPFNISIWFLRNLGNQSCRRCLMSRVKIGWGDTKIKLLWIWNERNTWSSRSTRIFCN